MRIASSPHPRGEQPLAERRPARRPLARSWSVELDSRSSGARPRTSVMIGWRVGDLAQAVEEELAACARRWPSALLLDHVERGERRRARRPGCRRTWSRARPAPSSSRRRGRSSRRAACPLAMPLPAGGCRARRPRARSPTSCRCGPCPTAPRRRRAGSRAGRRARAGSGTSPRAAARSRPRRATDSTTMAATSLGRDDALEQHLARGSSKSP